MASFGIAMIGVVAVSVIGWRRDGVDGEWLAVVAICSLVASCMASRS